MKRFWTDEEVIYLQTYYFKQGVKVCAMHLNRTPMSVQKKVAKLGLYHRSKNKTTESYIDELVDKGINIFPLEDYAGSHTNILHEGLDCGHTWSARPTNILSGKGCPECSSSGFNDLAPAVLYFVRFTYDEVEFYKLGITNRTPEERLVKDWKHFNMSIVWKVPYNLGKDARLQEQELLREYSAYQINTGCLTSGNTETFTCAIPCPKKKYTLTPSGCNVIIHL